MPLEMFLLDWSKTNYSSARAAVEQFQVALRTRQHHFTGRFHKPILAWKISQWIKQGKLKVPKKVDQKEETFKCEFIAPEFPWIDQLKESQAWGERIDRGLSTHGRANKSLGMSREDWLIERKREIEEALGISAELESKYPGQSIPWELFAGMGSRTTKTETISESTAKDETSDEEKPEEKKEGVESNA